MKRCLTLFSLYFIYLFSSCTPCSTKKISCDAFNEPLFFKWFPYHAGDRLSFKNANSTDTFSYVIANVDTTKAYEAQQGGFNNNNANSCYASAYISIQTQGTLVDIFHIQYSITTPFNGAINKYLEVYFKNTTWAVTEITESGFTNNSSGNNIATAVMNQNNVLFDNGITYPVLTALSSDTTGVTIEKPYKIFIAKNIGIIGIEMYPSLQKWIIQ